MKFDGKTVVSSDQAIAFDKAPAPLVVVGGGAIGLELGSVWARLGSDVTVVEFLPKIVAAYDDDVVRTFSRLLQKQGLKIETGAKVTGLKTDGGRTRVLTAERERQGARIPGGEGPGRRRPPALHGRARPRQGRRRARREEARQGGRQLAHRRRRHLGDRRRRRRPDARAQGRGGRGCRRRMDRGQGRPRRLGPRARRSSTRTRRSPRVGHGRGCRQGRRRSPSTSASSTLPPTAARSPTTRPTDS